MTNNDNNTTPLGINLVTTTNIESRFTRFDSREAMQARLAEVNEWISEKSVNAIASPFMFNASEYGIVISMAGPRRDIPLQLINTPEGRDSQNAQNWRTQ